MIRLAVGSDDAAAAGRVLGAGFADDPVMTWVFADGGPAATAALFSFLADEVYAPLGATFVSGDGGAIAWTPPDPEPWPDERGARLGAALDGVASGADVERLGVLSSVMDEHHPSERHWYLSAVAVDPARRGEGIGTSLLDGSLSVADDDALPAYLESTNPRNVPLYERFGFVVTRELHLPDGGPPLIAMWRDAR